jgi:hypothetical protein
MYEHKYPEVDDVVMVQVRKENGGATVCVRSRRRRRLAAMATAVLLHHPRCGGGGDGEGGVHTHIASRKQQQQQLAHMQTRARLGWQQCAVTTAHTPLLSPPSAAGQVDSRDGCLRVAAGVQRH